MDFGKSVRLFLVDGTSGGLVTAEIMNWTGHLVAAPRSDLATLLKRPEVARTGVYILLGDDPDSTGNQMAYVGEGDDVGRRLYQHGRPEHSDGKDFWDRAVVLTSKDTNLTKAHARYLESRFIELALTANRARLVNGTAPPRPALPEADRSDMEFFIAQARIVLPVLGVNILRGADAQMSTATATPRPTESPVFQLESHSHQVKATAQEVDGEFIVRAGSLARATWFGTAHSYQRVRGKLEADGTLAAVTDGGPMRFTRDHVFASPSAAAAVVLGRNANGRTEWKAVDSGIRFGDWQVKRLDDYQS